MKNKKTAILKSGIALLLCISMLIGSTFAWFTDDVTVSGNIIKTGTLDIEMYWTDDLTGGQWHNVEEDGYNTIFSYDNWEPGYTEVKYIKLVNNGELAFNYKLAITPQGEVGKLAEVINVYIANDKNGIEVTNSGDLSKLSAIGLLNNVMNGGSTANGTLFAADQQSPIHDSSETIVTIAMNMITTAGNEYQGEHSGNFTITALATQAPFESDSFGADYDSGSEYGSVLLPGKVTSAVAPVDGKVPTGGVAMNGSTVSAFVPAGVAVADNADKLTLTVTPLEDTTSGITVVNDEILIPVDVHIDGIAENNDVPIIIELGQILPKYMNMGNYHLFHVEDGVNNEMTMVADKAALVAHNQYTYDPLTGAVCVAMASFSEIALLAETNNAWKGEYDYTWYDASKTELTIANADQLAAFGAIVGGMNGQKQDSFAGKTVKLIADINLGDAENSNNASVIFYPIGYYNSTGSYTKTSGGTVTSSVSSFEGTFDGNGHTIANFYQNTWEMFGDYNSGYSGTPNHYKDAMGLFGYILNGTVKNLTVDNFSSDGEFTPTGVIAAYADGKSIFENIAITHCNPRVYNTGNGGIIGIAGDTSTANDDHITLKNITVDNSNKISALWGSYDVACGGLVGMYRGNVDGSGNATGDTISFENCHVSSIIDVYNDVCGNYQYYAYRYAGMIIGSVRHNTVNGEGKTIPNMTGISATGCTVNYGNWNDYYYCEFVKNGHPSYSGENDYKFSRVDKSDIIFDANGKVTGCNHEHSDVEDNRAIYLPFHQLFTGYSWGVSSIGLENWQGVEVLGIELGDQEESVVKFEKAQPLSEYPSGYTVNIEELFKEKSDNHVAIVQDAVQVFVSPVGDNSTAGATYNANTTDWTKGSITFTGSGTAKITITDYYFCTETSFEVTVVEGLVIDEFGKMFANADEVLYRVGNEKNVELGSLFAKLPGVTIQNTSVEVTVTAYDANADASGTFTKDETDWTKGTIDFNGTGVVKVTVKDCIYGNAAEIYLEVVDAYNVTVYSDLKDGRNSVFLNDINMANGGTYRLTGNHVLYGNGFTFNVKNGAYTGVDYDYASYVIYLEDSRLDNVKIEGAVYPEIGVYKTDSYNRAIVMTAGDCTITNSYISNGASPIRNGGNLELVNTTLKGGIYANLDLRNGHLILDNVTTINQVGANDKYNGTTEIVGMGIVAYQEGGTEELKITIRNKLTQYNYLSKTQADAYFTDTYSKQIKDVVFGNDFGSYKNGEWINFGIVSMNNYFTEEDLVDERSNKEGYFGTAKTITMIGNSRDCYVYSVKPASQSAPAYPGYTTAGQGVIKPTVTFDFTKNYQQKVEGSNDYCYADNGKVMISMDEGDTVIWDTSILTVKKNGQTLAYTVSAEGTDYTGKSITFNESKTLAVTYAFTDTMNYTLSDGTVQRFERKYTETVTIDVSVVKQEAKHAEFSFGANGTAYGSKTILVGDKTYVMPNVTATVSGEIGSTTVNGTTVYYPITKMYTSDGVTAHKGSWYACFPIFKDAVQIIDYADKGTGDSVTYNQSNVTTVAQIPSTLKAVNPTSAFLYQMNATNYPPPTDPTAVNDVVSYTCNRSGLTASNERSEMTVVAEYTYTDNAGTVYYYYVGYYCAEQTNGCVTPDTLITLANGKQVRVDSLKGDELLLVWNMETGKYESAPIVFVDSEQESEYEIIHLYFSDGSDVKVIYEHGFFDLDLGKYVYIDANNYADYVGHKFVKQGDVHNDTWKTVTLEKVVLETEVTTAWSPVTFEHLCYYTNGVLSMPGGISGLFNIFEVDTKTMTYDAQQMQKDIETYGLFTMEDFGGLIPEIAFEAFNGDWLKVSMGKGLLTWEDIVAMAERYIPLM